VIERSSQFISKFGAASVFLARFMAVVRAFVPLVAGIVRMSSRQFYLANILSALVWAPMHVFPGVLVGLAIALGGVHASELTLAAVGVLILAWIAWSMIKRKAVAIVCSPARQHAPRSSCGKAGPPQPRDHRPGRAV
jgi:membrane protein DedA with SNARE-associated domain